MVRVTASNMMEKELNNWPSVEEMFIVIDIVEEFCSLIRRDNFVLSSDTWIFLREACRFLVSMRSASFKLVWLNPALQTIMCKILHGL